MNIFKNDVVIPNNLQNNINVMSGRINKVLPGSSIYIFGSVSLGDFKYGWSDIDILTLTKNTITQEQAEKLVGLRQELVQEYNDNIYRLFEGGMLPLSDFIDKNPCTAVYWGTSGQRITDSYCFDAFSMYELLTTGILVSGKDVRNFMSMPLYDDMRSAVIHHYQTIRKYAVETGESIYSCGWLLDTARCIYTLRTGKVIAKTKAGEWAIEQSLCPVPESLAKAVEVRKQPIMYKDKDEYKKWGKTLGKDIQRFADVLENEINISGSNE